jgi:hypothetical protein
VVPDAAHPAACRTTMCMGARVVQSARRNVAAPRTAEDAEDAEDRWSSTVIAAVTRDIPYFAWQCV